LKYFCRLKNKKAVLIIDDEEHIRNHLAAFLKKDYIIYTASSIEEGKKEINNKRLDYAIIDLKLDDISEYGGIKLFRFLKQNKPEVKTIILSAYYLTEEVEEEFKNQLNEEADLEKLFNEAKNNYISKGGEKNYILAVLEKLKTLNYDK